MRRSSVKLAVASLLLCVAQASSAQVLQIIGCTVEKPGPFAGIVNQIWETMSDGYRPTVTLIATAVNGPNPQTHTVVLNHPDYERYEAWGARVAESPAAQLILERGSDISECNNQALLIERASWGNVGEEWAWNAVFPVTASDSATYAEAFGDLMTSDTGESVTGSTVLYEARAGGTNTHLIAVLSPSFAALNRDLDTLFSSDDYDDFIDAVGENRVLGVRSQSRHVRTWTP